VIRLFCGLEPTTMTCGHALSPIVQRRHCIIYFARGHCDESAMLAFLFELSLPSRSDTYDG
jgi:hypothetical protein